MTGDTYCQGASLRSIFPHITTLRLIFQRITTLRSIYPGITTLRLIFPRITTLRSIYPHIAALRLLFRLVASRPRDEREEALSPLRTVLSQIR